MMLSEFFDSFQIVRNSSFETLGLSNSEPGVSFLSFFDNAKFFNEMCGNTGISAVICKRENVEMFYPIEQIGIVISDNPRKEYFKLHNHLAGDCRYNQTLQKRLENRIGDGCRISKMASIAESGVIIGNNVVIDDFVRIVGPCRIGDNSIIHSGSIIGGEGFEFKRYQDGVLDVLHCGSVSIGDNVVIWEYSTIHKAVYPWDTTLIGSWSRIGAHSHIDHGAKIRNAVTICAHCTVSGRTEIKDHAYVGPGSIVSNRVSVGMNSKVLIGSVVTKNVDDENVISGNFAIDHKKHLSRVKEYSQ